MTKINDIKKLIEKMETVYSMVAEGSKKDGLEKLKELMPKLSELISEILNNSNKLASYGVEVPQDVIIQQIQNLSDALEKRDSILLTDTLHYEMKNTFLFYIDIIKECEKENIML